MPSRASVDSEIDLISTLKMITQVYQEIAVIRMQKVRNSVLLTREFLREITEIYYDVKRSYKKELELLLKLQKKKKDDIADKKALKQVAVLLSSNAKLYGSIVHEVIQSFLHYVREHPEVDLMIIGRLGKEMFNESDIKRKYVYFEIPDSETRTEDLQALIYHISQYDKVITFYGQFENILIQKPTTTNLSGDDYMTGGEGGKYRERSYLFEPSLKKILEFFQSQILVSLLKQTVHESQLSRYASRIRAMEESLEHIDERSGLLKNQQRKLHHLAENKKQLESMSGISLWSK